MPALWAPQAFLVKVNFRTNLPVSPFLRSGTRPVLWCDGKRMHLEVDLACRHSTSPMTLGKLLNFSEH